MNNIGKTIKKLREEKNITQEQLAEKLNVTRQAVSNWENGKTQPDIDTLTKISEIFEIPIEEIIYGCKKTISENITPQTIVKTSTSSGVGFGAALAMVISYNAWESIGWAILHGFLNWFYVIYYFFVHR